MPNVSPLRAELKEWPRYLRITEPTQSSASPNLAECHEHADEDIFPNFRTLLGIGNYNCIVVRMLWSFEVLFN